jgi:predicted enzyme related to lactoylglutathione lyase
MPRLKLLAALALAAALAACTAPRPPAPPDGLVVSPSPLYGKFVWRDLVTENPDIVKPFYAALFGWEYTESTVLGAPYTVVRHLGEPIAGITRVRRPDPAQPVSQWLAYVSVPDVDATVETGRRTGGSVLAGPTDLPGVGRAAVLADPQGAALGVLRTSFGDPIDRAPAVGRFAWTELLALDPAAAARFYGELLGYQVLEVNEAGGPYWRLARGGDRAGVLRQPIAGARAAWLSTVRVENAAASAERARALGARVLLAPRADVRGGTLAIIADPAGTVLALQSSRPR